MLYRIDVPDRTWRASRAYALALNPATDDRFVQLSLRSPTPASRWAINEAVSTWFLVHLREQIENASGFWLRPRYSVLRHASRGEWVKAHVDTRASNLMAFLPLHCDGAWPAQMFIEGEWRSITAEVGQAIVFHSREIEHRRPTYEGRLYVGCILAYSTQDDHSPHDWDTPDIDERARRGRDILDAADAWLQAARGGCDDDT